MSCGDVKRENEISNNHRESLDQLRDELDDVKIILEVMLDENIILKEDNAKHIATIKRMRLEAERCKLGKRPKSSDVDPDIKSYNAEESDSDYEELGQFMEPIVHLRYS